MRCAPAVSVLLLAAACAERGRIESLEVGPGDLVIEAVLDDAGLIREVETSVSVGSSHGRIADTRDELALFVIKKGDLVDPSGRPLGPERLAEVRVEVPARESPDAPRSAGACGRCLVIPNRPPAIVNAGDDCPLPPFARAVRWRGGDRESDAGPEVRGQIRLTWPGACGCDEGAPVEPFMDRALEPLDGTAPLVEVVASGPRGAVALVSADSVSWRPGSTTVPIAPEPEERIVGAALLDDGRVAIAARRLGEIERRASLLVVAQDGSSIRGIPDLSMDVHTMMRLPSFPSGVLLVGQATLGYPAALAGCAIGADGADCVELSSNALRSALRGGELRAVMPLPDGGFIAFGDAPAWVAFEGSPSSAEDLRGVSIDTGTAAVDFAHGRVRTSAGSSWRWAARRIPETTGTTFAAAAIAGGSMVVCVQATNRAEQTVAVVLAAQLDREDLFDPSRAPRWRETACAPGRCAGFAPLPGRNGAVRLSLRGERWIDLGPDGAPIGGTITATSCAVEPSRGREEGVDRPLRSVSQDLLTGTTIALSEDGAIFTREVGEARYVRVHGPASPIERSTRAVAILDRVAWVFGAAGAVARIPLSIDPDAPSIARAELGGFERDDRVLAAASDHERGGLVIAGDCAGEGCSWLRRVDAASMSVEPISGAPGAGARVHAIAEIGPGHHLLLASGRRILRMRDGAITAVPIRWDDPATPPPEVEPPPSAACAPIGGPERGSSASGELFRSVDGAGGVGWVTGCGGVLLRVDEAGATRLGPTRVLVARYAESDAFSSYAVRAWCPDRVVVGVGGRFLYSSGVRSTAAFISLVARTPRTADELVPPDFGMIGNLWYGRGWPDRIFGSAGKPFALLREPDRVDESTLLPAIEVTSVAESTDPLIAGARLDRGGLLLVSEHGRILRSR